MSVYYQDNQSVFYAFKSKSASEIAEDFFRQTIIINNVPPKGNRKKRRKEAAQSRKRK